MGEASALHPGYVLADAVDLPDVRPGLQENPCGFLLVAEGDAFRREAEQGRAASRDEIDDQCVLVSPRGNPVNGFGSGHAVFVRYRMPRLNDLNTLQPFGVTVLGDDDASGESLLQDIFDCGSHLGGGLADADRDNIPVCIEVLAQCLPVVGDDEGVVFDRNRVLYHFIRIDPFERPRKDRPHIVFRVHGSSLPWIVSADMLLQDR